MNQFNDEVGTETRIRLAFGGRQFHASESIRPMPVLSRNQFLIERVLRTASYHDVAAAGQRHDLQGVL